MIDKSDSPTTQSPDPHSGTSHWRVTEQPSAPGPGNVDVETPHHRVAVAAAGGAFMTL